MSRRGRKRKTGKRYACGKLKTSDPSPEQIGELRNVLANQMPHRTADVIWLDQRRKIPERKRSEDIAEHPLGRLCLVGAITRLQYSAGMQFGRAVAAARRVLDCRKPPQSIAGYGQPSPPAYGFWNSGNKHMLHLLKQRELEGRDWHFPSRWPPGMSAAE
jgi:hypothetical protein